MARARKRKRRPVDEIRGSETVINDDAVEQRPDDMNQARIPASNEHHVADPSKAIAGEDRGEPQRPLNSPSLKEEISFYERSILALTKRNKKLLLSLSQARYVIYSKVFLVCCLVYFDLHFPA